MQQCSCVHHSLCVRSSLCPPIWGRVIGHRVCCGSKQGVHAKKWPQSRVSGRSAPFVVVAATLFVYTRHRQFPADVPRLLSLVWCEMRRLCWERAMCEGRRRRMRRPPWSLVRHECLELCRLMPAGRPCHVGAGLLSLFASTFVAFPRSLKGHL